MLKILTTTLLALTLGAGSTLAQAQEGSAAAGAKKNDQCIGCHGIPYYRSSFPEVYEVPMIAGQNAKYIVAALNAYKKGDRKHPTMRGVAATLSEQDMADLAAFYEQQGAQGMIKTVAAREPSAAAAALLTKGGCASCHGADFSTPIDPSYPRIAGQHADYLYAALKSYQTEGNPRVGRNNAIMAGMASPFTHAELKTLANYLGSAPGSLSTVPQSRFR